MANVLNNSTLLEIQEAKRTGKAMYAIAKQLNIDYGTVRKYWNRAPIAQSAEARDLKSLKCRFESDSGYQQIYAYVLGLYLGDGYIHLQNKQYGVYQLRIEQDSNYPKMIQEHIAALAALTQNKVNTLTRAHSKSTTVYVYSKELAEMFPQHGTGSKNARKLILEDWQHKIISEHPRFFIRGLIQTDGSRYLHTQIIKEKTYQKVKYNFTNTSQDIVTMFCDACDAVGLHYTIHTRPSLHPQTKQPTGNNKITVTFNKEQDVTMLDSIVGVKE